MNKGPLGAFIGRARGRLALLGGRLEGAVVGVGRNERVWLDALLSSTAGKQSDGGEGEESFFHCVIILLLGLGVDTLDI